MCSMCASTVRLEMTSRPAISRLDSPSATSPAISHSPARLGSVQARSRQAFRFSALPTARGPLVVEHRGTVRNLISI